MYAPAAARPIGGAATRAEMRGSTPPAHLPAPMGLQQGGHRRGGHREATLTLRRPSRTKPGRKRDKHTHVHTDGYTHTHTHTHNEKKI